MSFLDTPIEDRVSAGIDWLNENGPAEWWDRVDLDFLDLADGNACILGQVFAADAATRAFATNGYAFAADNLLRIDGVDVFAGDLTGPLGFLVPYPQELAAHSAWIAAIEKIRVEVSA